MRNLTLSLSGIPVTVHSLAELEQAFETRRVQLQREAVAQLLAARSKACCRAWRYADRPRDGRGRYLTQAWLNAAEGYSPTDTAWFRSPIR